MANSMWQMAENSEGRKDKQRKTGWQSSTTKPVLTTTWVVIYGKCFRAKRTSHTHTQTHTRANCFCSFSRQIRIKGSHGETADNCLVRPKTELPREEELFQCSVLDFFPHPCVLFQYCSAFHVRAKIA